MDDHLKKLHFDLMDELLKDNPCEDTINFIEGSIENYNDYKRYVSIEKKLAIAFPNLEDEEE